MDKTQLVDEIVRRVSSRLAQTGGTDAPTKKPDRVEGKAISVRKVSRLFEHGVRTIHVEKTGIITAEAKDYIAEHHITVIRD